MSTTGDALKDGDNSSPPPAPQSATESDDTGDKLTSQSETNPNSSAAVVAAVPAVPREEARKSLRGREEFHHVSFNPLPQTAPGSNAAEAAGHHLDNSIPLSIFPIASADKFCFCFCGLPGRGKTHIARRLEKYLTFFHSVPVKLVSASVFRRERYGDVHSAEWFNPDNEETRAKKEMCNEIIIEDIIKYLKQTPNGCFILDSTNPTHERRSTLLKRVQTATGAKVMFIEVINENVQFLENQYKTCAASSPDYATQNFTDSLEEYRQKVSNYQAFYESVDSGDNHLVEKKWTYMKCDHAEQHFVVHKAKGYLQQKVVNFIMNLRTTSHAFYLSRHGQSEYNDLGRIGGDSGLTFHGVEYAKKLAAFTEEVITKDPTTGEERPGRLWTSTMRRTKETTQFIKQKTMLVKLDVNDSTRDYEWLQMRRREWHHLDELFAGVCDGMTYEEIEREYPDEWARRKNDKLAYRYPRGESYLDMIARLEPMIIEMERHQEPLLIVAHQGILRIIYAFYMGYTRNQAPHLSIPLNTIIELRPGAIVCIEKRTQLYTPSKSLPYDGQDEPMKKMDTDPPSH